MDPWSPRSKGKVISACVVFMAFPLISLLFAFSRLKESVGVSIATGADALDILFSRTLEMEFKRFSVFETNSRA